MPLPWMLGAMIAVTIAALGRTPVRAPLLLRTAMVPVLGVLLGSGFYPGMFDAAGEWVVTLIAMPFFIVLSFAAAFFVYRKIGGYDPITAYFSSAPGGLTDMMLVGAAMGGVERKIALAHSSRILFVVTGVALVYGLALDVRATGDARPYIGFADMDAVELALLAICALAGALLGPRIGLPAPQILGPMILSGGVHFVGLTDAPPPTLLVNAAQVVLGTAIGCRFAGVALSEVFRDVALAVLASSTMLIAAFCAASIVAVLAAAPIAEVFLAFSPGGLAEMGLLGLALGADIAYVASMHVVRITLVIGLAPLVFRMLGRQRRT